MTKATRKKNIGIFLIFIMLIILMFPGVSFASSDAELDIMGTKVNQTATVLYYKVNDEGTAVIAAGEDDYEVKVDYTDSEKIDIYLKNASLGQLVLPNPSNSFKSTIITESDSSVESISFPLPVAARPSLSFDGSGTLDIGEGAISFSGDGAKITIEKDAHVNVNGHYTVGSSGGVNGLLVVKGTMTIDDPYDGQAYTGILVIEDTGRLYLYSPFSIRGTGAANLDQNGIFIIERGGKFFAACDEGVTALELLVRHDNRNIDNLAQLPEGYTPSGYSWKTALDPTNPYIWGATIAEEDKVITLVAENVGGGANHYTLQQRITGISLNKATLLFQQQNESEMLQANFTPSEAVNVDLVWTSSNPSVATVDASGKVTSVSDGTTMITATVKDTDLSASCKVTVEVKQNEELKPGGTDNVPPKDEDKENDKPPVKPENDKPPVAPENTKPTNKPGNAKPVVDPETDNTQIKPDTPDKKDPQAKDVSTPNTGDKNGLFILTLCLVMSAVGLIAGARQKKKIDQ